MGKRLLHFATQAATGLGASAGLEFRFAASCALHGTTGSKYSDRGHSMAHKKMTMGLIVGNRGFFPDHLAKSGREEMVRVLEAADIDVVALTPEQSKYGAVETREESRRCADLFATASRSHRWDRSDFPNFGEERAIADTLRLADLRVPSLIQATPTTREK